MDAPETSWPVQRFCRQVLQAEPAPSFPAASLLRRDDVQAYLYAQLFAPAGRSENPLPPTYALRVLKALVAQIEASIDDWDEQGVSDDLMQCLANGSGGSGSLVADALRKHAVVYTIASLPAPAAKTAAAAATVSLFENRATIAAGGTTGIRTWEAALHLGEYLCAHRGLVAGRRVLELGAGTGYVSILCARHLGAALCVATDGAPEVVSSLPANVRLNALSEATDVVPRALAWGPPPPDWHWPDGEGVDVVLGADITFDARDMPDLLATVRWLASASPAPPAVLIAATERNKATFDTFTALAAEAFNVAQIVFPVRPRAEQAGPFYNDAVPIHICQLQLRA